MANVTTTTAVDSFMQSADAAAMRTSLGLGDSATKAVGTTAGTVAAGNDSRITGAVQTSRTVSAGTGLAGGGDLSADRTLSVSYGTTAGTSCQGNDIRLSDARVPTGTATGDLDGTYPAPIVRRIQGRTVSSTAPTNNQVLGWNGTQWVPMTVSGSGASETFPILATMWTGEAIEQPYVIPSGYKWADIYLGSGGDGGQAGEIRSELDPFTQTAIGGTGGPHGRVRVRKKVFVGGATIKMTLGAGGLGGQGPTLGTSTFQQGTSPTQGGDSILYFNNQPNSVLYQVAPHRIAAVLRNDPADRQVQSDPGQGGATQTAGGTPTLLAWNYQQEAIISAGGGGGGAANQYDPVGCIDGGNIGDINQILRQADGTPLSFFGTNGTIDAPTPPLMYNDLGGSAPVFFGGGGGAGVYANYPTNAFTRAGDGAPGQPGCGGGGGGGCLVASAITDPDSAGCRGGNGGAGGPGFLLLFLYK
jgi:hypothetical protein